MKDIADIVILICYGMAYFSQNSFTLDAASIMMHYNDSMPI